MAISSDFRRQRQPLPFSTIAGLLICIIIIFAASYLISRGLRPAVAPQRALSGMEGVLPGAASPHTAPAMVGTRDPSGARGVANVLEEEGRILGHGAKVRGVVARVISPRLFSLAVDPLREGGGEVLVMASLPASTELLPGADVIVEGQVVRVNHSWLPRLHEAGLPPALDARYDGQLALEVGTSLVEGPKPGAAPRR